MFSSITRHDVCRTTRHALHSLRYDGSFLLEFLKHPATVGSIWPSGTALSKRLVEAVPGTGDGLIIDLGAGSGPVSGWLLRSGVQAGRIIAIDSLAGFARHFAARCPGVEFVVGDARELGSLLDRIAPGRKVSAIISSLPLRAFPAQLARAIVEEAGAVTRERGGVFVQFSYALWMRYPLARYGLTPDTASVVWKNLPPARVEVYTARDSAPARTPVRSKPHRQRIAQTMAYGLRHAKCRKGCFSIKRTLSTAPKKRLCRFFG